MTINIPTFVCRRTNWNVGFRASQHRLLRMRLNLSGRGMEERWGWFSVAQPILAVQMFCGTGEQFRPMCGCGCAWMWREWRDGLRHSQDRLCFWGVRWPWQLDPAHYQQLPVRLLARRGFARVGIEDARRLWQPPLAQKNSAVRPAAAQIGPDRPIRRALRR